jgi:hypothetical protein
MNPPGTLMMKIEVKRRRRRVRLSALTLALAGSLSVQVSASAQLADDDLDALVEAREIPVTIDNFARGAAST